jgi:hypothetical protein
MNQLQHECTRSLFSVWVLARTLRAVAIARPEELPIDTADIDDATVAYDEYGLPVGLGEVTLDHRARISNLFAPVRNTSSSEDLQYEVEPEHEAMPASDEEEHDKT